MSDEQSGTALNTDRELWRERPDDYYSDSIYVNEGGGIGINVGGTVHVRSLKHWHDLAESESAPKPVAAPENQPCPTEQNDIPLCGAHAQSWFTERNLLQSEDCVVCAHAQPRGAHPPPEERAGFEKWNDSEDGFGFSTDRYADSDPDIGNEYRDQRLQAAWEAWIGRARAPQPNKRDIVIAAIRKGLGYEG